MKNDFLGCGFAVLVIGVGISLMTIGTWLIYNG